MARLHFWPSSGGMFLPAHSVVADLPGCGAGASRARTAPSTSTTPTASPGGFHSDHDSILAGLRAGTLGRSMRDASSQPSNEVGGHQVGRA